tara:strand:- start:107 stop:1015 length:909 start_codon:yes stop_codon:yes gene_type:complete
MASTTANLDINILANIVLEALMIKLDESNAFALGIETDVLLNDTVKVIVESYTKDASAWNESSNNYENEDDDASTGIDITLDQKIKKTAGVGEDVFAKLDISKKLAGLGHACAYQMLLTTYNTLSAANYTETEEVVGAASGFTYDDLIDLEVRADDTEFGPDRFAVLNNTYMANLKKDGILVTNKAANVDPGLAMSRFDIIGGFNTMGSTVIKNISGTPSTENLVGFVTDGTAMGVGLGTPAWTGQADGGVEVATVVDDKTGIGLQLRRHYNRAQGKWYLNAVILYGNAVVRSASLIRLVSA